VTGEAEPRGQGATRPIEGRRKKLRIPQDAPQNAPPKAPLTVEPNCDTGSFVFLGRSDLFLNPLIEVKGCLDVATLPASTAAALEDECPVTE